MDDDPDSWFARRGFRLRVELRNLDDALRRKGHPHAPSIGSTHWADLVLLRTGEVIQAAYGSGMSDEEAKERARLRYCQEQGSEEPDELGGHS
jgi:hypothetical protein